MVKKMYLALLNEKQKKLFFSLAYDLAASDGDFSEDEKMAIKSYESEMELELKMDEIDTDLDRIISEMNTVCELREKKIIVFELIGLAMADYHYDDGEKDIIYKALNILGLEKDFGVFCERKLTEYFNLQDELNMAILQ